MRRLLLSVLVALALPACDKTPAAPPLQDGQLDPVNPHPGGEGGGVTPLPDPEEQSGRVGRSARRLTVAQLGRSIETAVGQPWTDLDARAASLGRADYALINAESTEPNLVFAKFLEEGARKVCLAQATAERKLGSAQDRALGRKLPDGTAVDLRKLNPAQVDESLVYLSTRFWGAPLQGEELVRWRGFFTQAATRAHTVNKPEQAMAVVCIALMTDSRFLTY